MLSESPGMMQKRTRYYGVCECRVGKECLMLREISTPVLDKGEVIINGRQVGGGLSVCLHGNLEMFCIFQDGFQEDPGS